MQEAKDLHFTENYLPQISKKSGTNEETQMLSSYGMKQNAMSTTGIYIFDNQFREAQKLERFEPCRQEGETLFYAVTYGKMNPNHFLNG